jgi:hypothetical protein
MAHGVHGTEAVLTRANLKLEGGSSRLRYYWFSMIVLWLALKKGECKSSERSALCSRNPDSGPYVYTAECTWISHISSLRFIEVPPYQVLSENTLETRDFLTINVYEYAVLTFFTFVTAPLTPQVSSRIDILMQDIPNRSEWDCPFINVITWAVFSPHRHCISSKTVLSSALCFEPNYSFMTIVFWMRSF